MRKTTLFSIFTALFFSFSALGQIGLSGSGANKNRQDNEEIMNQYLKGIKKNADPSDNIKGSPYLEEDFQTAQLLFPKNDPLEAHVRYNVAKEEMQVQIGTDSYKVLHRGVVVDFNNNPFKMYTYKGEDKTVDLIGYFQILSPDQQESDLVLMRKYKKEVRRGKAAAAMQQATPPRYVTKDDFYLKFGSSKPVMAERRTKKFLKLFPKAHRSKIKTYMKENKYKSRDETDLKAIVNYYNQAF